MTDTKKWESYVAQNWASYGEIPSEGKSLFELMHETTIRCHGGGSDPKKRQQNADRNPEARLKAARQCHGAPSL